MAPPMHLIGEYLQLFTATHCTVSKSAALQHDTSLDYAIGISVFTKFTAAQRSVLQTKVYAKVPHYRFPRCHALSWSRNTSTPPRSQTIVSWNAPQVKFSKFID